ncbi:MAG: GNAT family N-acetyltransferase [Gammaproteobacteria bacterium]
MSPKPQVMRIVPLGQVPHFAGPLAAAHAAEWQHLYEHWDTGHALQDFAVQHSDGRLPATLVALAGDDLLGSVSLIFDDLPGWEHLNPWLASFYVFPAHRRCGVGTALLAAADALFRAQRVACAFLFTETRARYFTRRGWRALAPTEVLGHHVTIMRKDFLAPARQEPRNQ